MTEAAYIPLARKVILNTELEKKAHEDRLSFRRSCATAMQASGVTSFTLDFANRNYSLELKRPQAQRIHKRRLYVLLANGDITIDEFLDCIEVPFKNVSETLGEDRAKSLLETYKKSYDLVIKES